LAACVRQLVDDVPLREQMGRNARAWALKQFSPAARLPEILDLYRKEKSWTS
jgi:glycosyltransferase involved in cell wall biosynthesis